MTILEQDEEDKIFSHGYLVTGFRPEIKIGKKVSVPLTFGINAWQPTGINDRNLKGMFQEREYYFQVAPYAAAGLSINFK